jgi:membrane-bound metal-dependent hydrolase YbcI (DUF457 family)
MFAGHFGLAAAVGAKQPKVPLWALMVVTQLLDIAFVPLFVAGIEPMDTSAGSGYGESIIHADYTHSLLGALLIAVFAGLIAAKAWGKQGGITVGSVVFSHWILDLLVHHPDLPILPGNAGNLPKLGFGLWISPIVCGGVELLLITFGFTMYVRSIHLRSLHLGRRTKVWTAGAVMGILLCLSLVTDFLGI